jgi:hypothetical protein
MNLDTIISPAVRESLVTFLSQDTLLNPRRETEFDKSFAIDRGVLLEIEKVTSGSLADPENPDEYIPECCIEGWVYVSDIDSFDMGQRGCTELRNTGEYGEQLSAELMDVFTETLQTYNSKPSIEFAYMGERRDGHGFRVQLHFNRMTGAEVTEVAVWLKADAMVTRNVPTSVAEQGQEALQHYLIDKWWRRTERAEKARMFNITNQFYPVDEEGRQLDSMLEHMGVEMEVEPVTDSETN